MRRARGRRGAAPADMPVCSATRGRACGASSESDVLALRGDLRGDTPPSLFSLKKRFFGATYLLKSGRRHVDPATPCALFAVLTCVGNNSKHFRK